MPDVTYRAAFLGTRQLGPWTVCGGPDPDFDDVQRAVHHALLTDTNLLTTFRRRFPARRHADYDQMVRLLDYVWDCPHDRTANVVGFRCGRCGHTRASAQVAQFSRGADTSTPLVQWHRPATWRSPSAPSRTRLTRRGRRG